MADQLTIGVRFALYVNLMLVFGLPFFGLIALRGEGRLQTAILPLRALTGWLSASGIALSLISIIAMTASMAGVPLNAVDSASVGMMIFETPMGNAWLVRAFALLATLAVALWIGGANGLPKLQLMALGSGVALASLAWTGHGAASEGLTGSVHLVADIIHLLAAGTWLGALAALTVLLFRSAETVNEDYLRMSHRLLKGFSATGTILVALVLGTGLVNSWMLVGPHNMLTLHTTLYGQLLIAKLLLFGVMLGLATVNRFTLTPALELTLKSDGIPGATTKLRQSLALELGTALIILGLVAWLGTLEPSISM